MISATVLGIMLLLCGLNVILVFAVLNIANALMDVVHSVHVPEDADHLDIRINAS